MPALDLSIVIVNWNATEELLACLDSIPKAAGTLTYEVIVVDNKSSQFDASRLREAHTECHVVESETNVGFGAGVELGRTFCRGDYIASSNPDLLFAERSLERLVRFLAHHPKAGVAAPADTANPRKQQDQSTRLPRLTSALADFPLLSRLTRSRNTRTDDAPCRSEVVKGACLVFPALALEAIGGFPTDTFLYAEEILVGHRMLERGLEVWLVPAAMVSHATAVSTDQIWTQAETLLRRRQARIVAMSRILPHRTWLLWNVLSAAGLTLQLWLSRGRSPAPTGRLRKLHFAVLRSRQPPSL